MTTETTAYPSDQGSQDPFLSNSLKDRNRVTKELSLLEANDCVSVEYPKGYNFTFKIHLLPKGLIRGDMLSSLKGRGDLWYNENKNGILGLAITIIVSIITAWITSMIVAE